MLSLQLVGCAQKKHLVGIPSLTAAVPDTMVLASELPPHGLQYHLSFQLEKGKSPSGGWDTCITAQKGTHARETFFLKNKEVHWPIHSGANGVGVGGWRKIPYVSSD